MEDWPDSDLITWKYFFFRKYFFPPSGDTYLVILLFLILAVTLCLDPIIQELPTYQPSTGTSCQISSRIRLEIQCIIYVMRLNHPHTFPPHPWSMENCLHEISPWCQKAWGPLLSFWVTRQWYSNSISYFLFICWNTKMKILLFCFIIQYFFVYKFSRWVGSLVSFNCW